MKLDALLKTLSEAPDNQIDAVITTRIKALIGGNRELVAIELKTILDDCAHASLASDFGMWALDHAWTIAQTKP